MNRAQSNRQDRLIERDYSPQKNQACNLTLELKKKERKTNTLTLKKRQYKGNGISHRTHRTRCLKAILLSRPNAGFFLIFLSFVILDTKSQSRKGPISLFARNGKTKPSFLLCILFIFYFVHPATLLAFRPSSLPSLHPSVLPSFRPFVLPCSHHTTFNFEPCNVQC